MGRAQTDELGNYLILVYYSEEEGMGQYGWTISAILEDEMYGGFVDDVSGAEGRYNGLWLRWKRN